MESESVFVQREPCPACGSRDNLARYSDGHAHCFGQMCDYYEPADEEFTTTGTTKRQKKKRMSDDLLDGKYSALKARGITEETCRLFDYMVGKMGKQPVHIANYRDADGSIVAQHIRDKDKNFPWLGSKKGLQLFGMNAFRESGSKAIITEGEIDAMSVYQSLGGKSRFACFSVPSGAKGAKKDISENLQRLKGFDEVVLMFDNDEAGEAAAQECARLFPAGKCKIAKLPLKDANEMLLAKRSAEVVDAVFAAKVWRPEGVVRIADVRQGVLEAPVIGLPYWHEGLTKATLGRRMGECIALGAGTGVGKTDFITQQVEFDINQLGEKVGIFFYEQQPFESVRRLAGKMKGRRFHIPPDEGTNPWTQDELVEAVDDLERDDRLFMYDHFGSTEWSLTEDTIRYLYHSEGVRIFYVDHLTALASHADDERKELERVMADIGGLVKELDIWICLVSHLATPEGKPHEEGGRVMIRHFKGSRAIGYWCHFMFGIERNQQAEDEDERQTTRFRVLKDRVTGQSTGRVFELGYDAFTGRLVDKPPQQESAFPAVDDASAIF